MVKAKVDGQLGASIGPPLWRVRQLVRDWVRRSDGKDVPDGLEQRTGGGEPVADQEQQVGKVLHPAAGTCHRRSG